MFTFNKNKKFKNYDIVLIRKYYERNNIMPDGENVKWKIPYGLKFDKLSKIITLILTKKGDNTKLDLKSFSPLTGMSENFISSNLSFLNSINVIDGDNQGFKLTPKGIDFANALSMDDKEKIKTVSLELISKSHLNDLKVMIENQSTEVTKEKLYKFMKTKAKIKGETLSDMPTNSSTGMNAILGWFGKIGLVSNELANSKISGIPSKKRPQGTKRETQSTGGITAKSISKNESDNFVLNTDHISLLISKNIELDDLEFAKKQADLLFERAKTKINSKSD